MFSGLGSYFWGTTSDPGCSSSAAKKKLQETELTGSDGDEWVLINETHVTKSGSRKTDSPSDSPKAKKSRSRKSGTPARVLEHDATNSAALQFVSGRKISGKIHRKRGPIASQGTGDAILTEGEKLLHEIERGDFPTIEEGLKTSCPRKKSSSGAAAVRGKSYADIAKKVPLTAASTDDTSSCTPQSVAASSDATTSSSSSSSSSSSEEQVASDDVVRRVRRKSPAAVLSIVSNSQHAIPSSSSSLGKSKKKKRLSCHGLHGQMEGSWFVTPPPCFTKPNTFDMTSSPLEDMLIEKPVIRSSHPVAVDKVPLTNQEEDNDHVDEEDDDDDQVLLSPVTVRSSSPVSLIAELTEQQSHISCISPAVCDSPDYPSLPLLAHDQESESDDSMPELESSNDSNRAHTGSTDANEDNASNDEAGDCSKSNPTSRDDEAVSITTSVSSISDHEEEEADDEDQDENECMSPPPHARGRKRSRLVARSSTTGLIMPPANSSLTEVQLNSYRILSRKERKGRKSMRRKNQKTKKNQNQTGDSCDPMDREAGDDGTGISTKRSASSERLMSAIRALAYEPVLQSKAMQDQSQKIFLKSSFLDRQNHVIHHHHHSNHASSRKIKYATRPNTFSTNRKTNRNC